MAVSIGGVSHCFTIVLMTTKVFSWKTENPSLTT